MERDYFKRVARETSTRLWINNPSARDALESIAVGATGCTTNPQYCQKLLQQEPDYLRSVIDEVMHDTEDVDVAAERVCWTAAIRLMELFHPLYEESSGTAGHVTIQGDPRLDSDSAAIVDEALRFHSLGDNYVAKIPATLAGLQAIETLVTQGVPVCATEVFTMSQAIDSCETYRRATDGLAVKPPFYVTHITGILDQYWSELVKSERIEVSDHALTQAGCIVARQQYHLLRDRGYRATMLGGGARGTHHITEMVGGDMCITINWSTVQELLDQDEQIVDRIHAPVPNDIVEELSEKLPNFRRAFDEGALARDEYEDFGPLVLFRTNFLNGYARLIDEIRDRHHGHGATAGASEQLEPASTS
jgi:transaldolase